MPGAAAQDNGANDISDSTAVVLARADSARAKLVQPPGEYRGIRAMDVIRAPFQIFGAGLALGLGGVGITYKIADRFLIEPAIDVRNALIPVGIDVRVGSLGSRSSLAPVIRYEGLSPFFAEVGYSLRQYQLYRAGVALGARLGFSVEGAGSYRRLREPQFWGIGPDSREEYRSDYAMDVTDAIGTARWSSADRELTFIADGGWERTLTAPGWDDGRPDTQELFGAASLFGLDETVEFARVGGRAELDLTSLLDLHLRGFFASAAFNHYEGVGGTTSSFEQVAGDARVFVPVNERTVLALRVIAEDHLGESGHGVPFTHLARLGDDRGLRGYSGRRFQDLAAAAGQLEWRYEVYWHPGFPALPRGRVRIRGRGDGRSLAFRDPVSQLHVTPGMGLRLHEQGQEHRRGLPQHRRRRPARGPPDREQLLMMRLTNVVSLVRRTLGRGYSPPRRWARAAPRPCPRSRCGPSPSPGPTRFHSRAGDPLRRARFARAHRAHPLRPVGARARSKEGESLNRTHFDDVVSSAWWERRMGYRAISPEELARGHLSKGAAPDMEGDAQGALRQGDGVTPGFVMEDAKGDATS